MTGMTVQKQNIIAPKKGQQHQAAKRPKIESQTEFLIRIVSQLVVLPFTLLMVLLRKKPAKELFQPIADVIHHAFEPRFTVAVIALNSIIFLLMLLYPEQISKFVITPTDLFNPGKWYTFITAGWLHAGWLHIIANMAGVWVFGRILEKSIGTGKTALIYFVALIIGNIAHAVSMLIMGMNTPALGASGALMGFVSAAMFIDPFYISWDTLLPLPIMVVSWLTIYADFAGVLSPHSDGIARFAHLGGYASVTLTMFLFGPEFRAKLKKGLIINILSFAVAAAGYYVWYRFFA